MSSIDDSHNSTIRFVLDAMLGNLARWLRMLGYDTLYDPNCFGKEAMVLANDQKRVFITKSGNRSYFKDVFKHSSSTIFQLESKDIKSQLTEIVQKIPINLEINIKRARCSKCNGVLKKIDNTRARILVPRASRDRYEHFYECIECGSAYWEGSHWEKIRNTLQDIQNDII